MMFEEWRLGEDGLYHVQKTPAEVIDWGFDYAGKLGPNEPITSSTWTLEPGITAGDSGYAGIVTRQFFAGGTLGRFYRATNTITSALRVFQRTLVIEIVEFRG